MCIAQLCSKHIDMPLTAVACSLSKNSKQYCKIGQSMVSPKVTVFSTGYFEQLQCSNLHFCLPTCTLLPDSAVSSGGELCISLLIINYFNNFHLPILLIKSFERSQGSDYDSNVTLYGQLSSRTSVCNALTPF